MVPVLEFMFAIFVLTGEKNVGVSHALLTCEETSQYGAKEDEQEPSKGAATADSRGAIYIMGNAGDYHCKIWKEGYEEWYGTFNVDPKHLRFEAHLTKKKE